MQLCYVHFYGRSHTSYRKWFHGQIIVTSEGNRPVRFSTVSVSEGIILEVTGRIGRPERDNCFHLGTIDLHTSISCYENATLFRQCVRNCSNAANINLALISRTCSTFPNAKINNGRRAQWGRPNEDETRWQVFREYNVHVGRARGSCVTEMLQQNPCSGGRNGLLPGFDLTNQKNLKSRILL
jgi:hypothetical protein